MSSPAGRTELDRLAAVPALRPALLESAGRGLRVQLVLRTALALFVLGVVLIQPPATDQGVTVVVAVAYLCWSVALAGLMLRPSLGMLRNAWMTLAVDLVVLGTLSVIAGRSPQSWTEDILVNGFFLLPVLATTQLRAWVAGVVGGAALGLYVLAGFVSQQANEEPTSAILLRSGALAAVVVACVLLAGVQRSRVTTIGALLAQRAQLTDELVGLEQRERLVLSEALHDGALQYVLAARQDLEDARETSDPTSFDRLDQALTESGRLLRQTVTQLHPAVLEQAGLATALSDLVDSFRRPGGPLLELDANEWPPQVSTDADELLYASAREGLANALKHASAQHIWVRLWLDAGRAGLTVSDDGVGVEPAVLDRRLGAGHVGLASRRIRAEAAGGTLTVGPRQPRGTVVTVVVPATDVDRA